METAADLCRHDVNPNLTLLLLFVVSFTQATLEINLCNFGMGFFSVQIVLEVPLKNDIGLQTQFFTFSCILARKSKWFLINLKVIILRQTVQCNVINSLPIYGTFLVVKKECIIFRQYKLAWEKILETSFNILNLKELLLTTKLL